MKLSTLTAVLGTLVLLVACGSSEPPEPEESFCLYEVGTCHYAYSTIVGDTILNYDSTCPAPEDSYVTECQDLYEGGSCAGLEGQSTTQVDEAQFLDNKRNPRQIDGGTCADWNANPNSFDDPSPAAGSAVDDGGGDDSSSGTGGGAAACAYSCVATSEVGATCWDEPVACESITTCDQDVHACSDSTEKFDCAAQACGTCGITDSGTDACAHCAVQRCCESTSGCYYDDTCSNCTYATCPSGTNTIYDGYLSCLSTWCSTECGG